MGECIPVLTLLGQKKTAPVRRNRQQLPKISGFLISKANLMRGVSALAKEIKTLWHKTLKLQGLELGWQTQHPLAPMSTPITTVQDVMTQLPSWGSQLSRLSISGWTHRGPGTNWCSQPVICHTDLTIPSVVAFMFLSLNPSVTFEIAPKHTILDSFADYDGYSISSKGFLPTLVDVMVIWIKFTHSSPF